MSQRRCPPTGFTINRLRRKFLTGLGAGMTLSLIGVGRANSNNTPRCVVRPQQTAGPYFLDQRLERSDVRSDPVSGLVSKGKRLDLVFVVSQVSANSCDPIRDAIVDIWQCDAQGVYSGFKDFNDQFDTRGSAFLRGYQRTDSSGMARFSTIFPGWYPGRAVHVHYKVVATTQSGQALEHVSQLYFHESDIASIYRQHPYVERSEGWPENAQDGVFRRGGEQLVVSLEQAEDHVLGLFELGLEIPG